MGAGGGRGRPGPVAPEAQLGVDLGQGSADGGAELQLLRLELGHEVRCGLRVAGGVALPLGTVVLLGVLPLAAAGGDRQGIGSQRDGATAGVHHQEFLFDTDGAHSPMIVSPVVQRWLSRSRPPHRGIRRYVPLSPTSTLLSAGPAVPLLLLVTLRPPPRLPRLLMRRPEGAVVGRRQVSTKIIRTNVG